MSDNVLAEILAALTALDRKIDALDANAGTRLTVLDTRLTALDTRLDALAGEVTKLRTGLSERLDHLSNEVGFLRDDNQTTFAAADRATRINQDVNKSFNEQLASMVRQIRTLDNRLRTLEEAAGT
jgi:hypothetical protein